MENLNLAFTGQERIINAPLIRYPTDPILTGHSPDILMPGLFAFSGFSRDAKVLTCCESAEVRALSLNEEFVLAQVVSEKDVTTSIACIANKLMHVVENPDETVFSAVQTGGDWLYNRLNSQLPLGFMKNRYDIKIKRTEKGHFVEPTMVVDFTDSVRDKVVWIIEDLGDHNVSLACAARSAWSHGAKEVHIAMLVNKLGVKDKLFLPELQIVGLGIPDYWVGGAGADVTDELCRNFPGIWAKMTYQKWNEINQKLH